MKVYSTCPNCEYEQSTRTHAQTRVELAMHKGEEIDMQCQMCNQTTAIPVDAFYAKPSSIAPIMALLAFALGTASLFIFIWPLFEGNARFYLIGADLSVPTLIYGIVTHQENTRVRSFNNSKLRGHISNIKMDQ